MSAGNSVTLVGNLTKEPELRFTSQGRAQAIFSIAVNRRRLNQQTQDWEETTSFFEVICWGDLADNVATSLEKGSRAIVYGRLEQRSWETPEGERRSRVQVVAEEVGPSLRWATADVHRTERRTGQTRPVNNEPSPAVDGGIGYEEEPF
jgi:single-strand DNA-binding protein